MELIKRIFHQLLHWWNLLKELIMPMLRIQNNQIFDETINADTKVVDGSITGIKLVDDLIYNSNLTVTGTADLDDIRILGSNITSVTPEISIGTSALDRDFRVITSGNNNTLFVDGATDSVNLGTSAVITDVQLQVAGTDSVMLSKGTTAERPAIGVEGMIRFNTTIEKFEYFNTTASEWLVVGQDDLNLITTESFVGDDVTTIFTLSEVQTTASCIVSIDGIVQLPNVAYTIGGTTLTFTGAPILGDVIEVRKMASTMILAKLNNGDNTATVEALTGQGIVEVKGDLLPIDDALYDLGSAGKQWKDLHLTGTTIYLGGLQIQNQGGTFKFLQADGNTPATVDLGTELDTDIGLNGGLY